MVLRLHCDAASNRIFVAAQSTGVARAYRLDGELLWEQRLPEFDGSRIFLNHQGTVVAYGTYSTESVLRLGSDLLLVQAKVITRVKSAQVNPHGGRGTEEDAGIVTYVLSAGTGRLLTRASGAPLIGTATTDLAVSYRQDPFPRVTVMPWREARR